MFNITDHVDFDPTGRAICPSCAQVGKDRSKNLSLIPNTDGAYKCHRGCTPDEIRDALGMPKNRVIPTALAQPTVPPKGVTVSPQKVRENHEQLLNSSGPAKQWLHQRGITNDMIAHFKLGIARAQCKAKDGTIRHLPSISIPLPNADGTQYYQKKRLAPWLPAAERPDGYKAWSQAGIPAHTFVTHQPDNPKQTWLCEGEWDAIRLAWAVRHSDLKNDIQVATFTCGCDSVPKASAELDRLLGTVTIFYDRNDKPLKDGTIPSEKGAKKAAISLGDRAKIALVPMPDDCTIHGWDVSDALNHGFTLSDFQKAASTATFTRERDKSTIDIAAIAKTRKGRLLEALRDCYGERLRYSTLAKQVELDEAPIDPDFVYLSLLEEGLDVGSKEFAIDAFLYLAKKHQYNPVQQYLERVASQYGANPDLLNQAAARYLGNTNPLHNTFLRKTLIAAVARALNPGCKVDTALIFFGRQQGQGKSTFWAILGGEWFCDSLSGQTSDTDEKLKLYSAWIHEWAELEQVFKRKDTSNVKSFLSATTDTFRQPWGRSAEKHPRHSIIVGTTNEDDFLTDATGNRRYWVVPIKSKVCLELLERDRDQLWAAAVHAYREGASWILSQDEAIQSEQQNQHYQREDPWFNKIEDWTKFRDSIRVSDLLEQAIGLELARQDRSAQMRVADCLKTLGWQKRHTEFGKIWVKGSQVVSHDSESSHSNDSKTDYLLSLGSQEVVSSQDLTLDHSNDHFHSPDYLNEEGSQGQVVSPETISGNDFQPSTDYLTTKNAPTLSAFSKSAKSDHPSHTNNRQSVDTAGVSAHCDPPIPGAQSDHRSTKSDHPSHTNNLKSFQDGDRVEVFTDNRWRPAKYVRPDDRSMIAHNAPGLHPSHWVERGRSRTRVRVATPDLRPR
mgnify:FL=1